MTTMNMIIQPGFSFKCCNCDNWIRDFISIQEDNTDHCNVPIKREITCKCGHGVQYAFSYNLQWEYIKPEQKERKVGYYRVKIGKNSNWIPAYYDGNFWYETGEISGAPEGHYHTIGKLINLE